MVEEMDMERLLGISPSYMATCLDSNYFLPHLFYTELQLAQVSDRETHEIFIR
jgi:hypothetical protein